LTDDKRKFDNSGNATPFKEKHSRSGADPPENGMGGTTKSISESGRELRSRYVSAGNDFCINAAKIVSNNKSGTLLRSIRHMRSLCLSESAILFTSGIEQNGLWFRMTSGQGGQILSISLTGVLSVQRSRQSRRSGDSKTTLRQRRHT
jgi:hypothetical protein